MCICRYEHKTILDVHSFFYHNVQSKENEFMSKNKFEIFVFISASGKQLSLIKLNAKLKDCY